MNALPYVSGKTVIPAKAEIPDKTVIPAKAGIPEKTVIPAKAGIQVFEFEKPKSKTWVPAFAGTTGAA